MTFLTKFLRTLFIVRPLVAPLMSRAVSADTDRPCWMRATYEIALALAVYLNDGKRRAK